MTLLHAAAALVLMLAGGTAASAQEIPDLKRTWTPKDGVHLVEDDSRHAKSGTVPGPGDDTLQRHGSKFVFRFDGQDGRTFWGELSSAEVSEKLVGAISVDGKRFVIADHDGTFNGLIVDADTLDYCYAHVAPTDVAVACGLPVRDR